MALNSPDNFVKSNEADDKFFKSFKLMLYVMVSTVQIFTVRHNRYVLMMNTYAVPL